MQADRSDVRPYGRMVEPGMRASASTLRVPSVLRCGLMLFAVKVSLRLLGFSRTIDRIRRRVEGIQQETSVDPETLRAAEHAVAMAGALYPGRALCLEQSLTLYYLLRMHGIGVKYCQGVQAHPFVAHAWVEYRGVPINDVMEHVSLFARLPEELR